VRTDHLGCSSGDFTVAGRDDGPLGQLRAHHGIQARLLSGHQLEL